MVEYRIDENLIWRDGDPIAMITKEGDLHFESVDDEKYQLPIHNELVAAGRVRDDGTYSWIAPEESQGGAETNHPENSENSEKPNNSENPEKLASSAGGPAAPELKTVRQLCDVIAKMTGEAPPPFSKVYGDETDEVWAWIGKHSKVYREISRNYLISIKNNRMEV